MALGGVQYEVSEGTAEDGYVGEGDGVLRGEGEDEGVEGDEDAASAYAATRRKEETEDGQGETEDGAARQGEERRRVDEYAGVLVSSEGVFAVF